MCGEELLIQPLVHALQHGVVVGVLVGYGEVLFDAGNTAEAHVLGDFYGVGAPRGDHLTARTYKVAAQLFVTFGCSVAEQPAEFLAIGLRESVVAFYGDDALLWGSEK